MALWLVLSEGRDPGHSEPILATSDSLVLKAVGEALARRLGASPRVPLRKLAILAREPRDQRGTEP